MTRMLPFFFVIIIPFLLACNRKVRYIPSHTNAYTYDTQMGAQGPADALSVLFSFEERTELFTTFRVRVINHTDELKHFNPSRVYSINPSSGERCFALDRTQMRSIFDAHIVETETNKRLYSLMSVLADTAEDPEDSSTEEAVADGTSDLFNTMRSDASDREIEYLKSKDHYTMHLAIDALMQPGELYSGLVVFPTKCVGKPHNLDLVYEDSPAIRNSFIRK